MPYTRLFDLHTHSENSPDGKDSVTDICEKAIDINLAAVAITDHFEVQEIDEGFYEPHSLKAYEDMIKAKAEFGGKLEILSGIELGTAIYDTDYSKKLLKRDYDFVLSSLHWVEGAADYHLTDYKKTDYRPLLENYFNVMLAQCKLNLFDSLAHIDYPTRYIRLQGVKCDITPYSDQIDEILKYLAENGKAIEINTSGLFAPFHNTMPNVAVIKRFKELGGEFVTTGSDSHGAENIGRGLESAMEMLESAGFKYVTYYKKRKPIPVKIEKI